MPHQKRRTDYRKKCMTEHNDEYKENCAKVKPAQGSSPKKNRCTPMIGGRPEPKLPTEPEPKKQKVVMAPCDQIKSYNDNFTYKANYDTGPANPPPQDERDKKMKENDDNPKQEAEDKEDYSNLQNAWEMFSLTKMVFAKTAETRPSNLRANTELPDKPKKEAQELKTHIPHIKENNKPPHHILRFNKEVLQRPHKAHNGRLLEGD